MRTKTNFELSSIESQTVEVQKKMENTWFSRTGPGRIDFFRELRFFFLERSTSFGGRPFFGKCRLFFDDSETFLRQNGYSFRATAI